MTRRRTITFFLGTMLLAITVLAPESFGAANVIPGISMEAIGLIDPAKIENKFPDYIRLKELKKAYDSEFYVYSVYLRSQAQSFMAELNKQKDAECAGKSDAEKKAIAANYATKAQAKQTELNQQIQAKFKELQDKLNAEMAKVDQKLKEVIAVISQEKHLVIVLNKTAVYFGGTDITDEVIAKAVAKN